MNQLIENLHLNFQKMIGLHRRLLELVRQERVAIAGLSRDKIQEAVYSKQALLQSIRVVEQDRQKIVGGILGQARRTLPEVTMSNLILLVQEQDQAAAETLRSGFNALSVLVKHIREQNEYNRTLLEKSMQHIQNMKRNVLGERDHQSMTYGAKGNKNIPTAGSRLLSKEA